MSKRYWEKPITLRLTPYQRKVLSEIVDGSADAGACKDGLSKAESNALLSIHMRLIGATDAQKKIDELFEPEAQSLPREAELRDDEAPPTKYWREMYYDLLKHADTLLAREAELRRALEPCPFCGGEAGYYASGEAVFKANWIGHVCHCKNCQARIITSAGMDAAVQMWNARAITTPALNEGEREAEPNTNPWAETDPLADLVARFSAALLTKLRAAERKYGWNDGWMRDDWREDCQRQFLEHAAKGDPRDVANYCAFMWHHGWPTALRSPPGCWQPIETAPKDRSAILLYEDENMGLGPFIGYWSGVQWLPLTASSRWEPRVTHWMPLPAAPDTEGR